jgi:hypothetical protein
MQYEVVRDKNFPFDWRVEAFSSDGDCYVTVFSGPDAEARAREYANWKDTTPPFCVHSVTDFNCESCVRRMSERIRQS